MEANEKGCKLFVGGLSHDTTDATLLDYFKSFGTVISAIVLRDSETLSSRGFGFVSFSNKQEAQKCIDHGSVIIDNKEVEIKYAKPRPSYLNGSIIPETPLNKSSSSDTLVHQESDYIPTKIFVGGLLYSTNSDSLESYFSTFGDIETTEIIYNKETKISRGFGFVQFRDPKSARQVIYHQQNIERHKIDGKKVEVKRCLKKNDPENMGIENIPVVSDNSETKTKKTNLSVPLRKRVTQSKVFSFADAAKFGTKHETSPVLAPIKQDVFKNIESLKSQVSLDNYRLPKNNSNRSFSDEIDFLPNFDDLNFEDTDQEPSESFLNTTNRIASNDKDIWQSQINGLSPYSYNNGLPSARGFRIDDYESTPSQYVTQDVNTVEQLSSRQFRNSRTSNPARLDSSSFKQHSLNSNSYREMDDRINEYQFDYYQGNSRWK